MDLTVELSALLRARNSCIAVVSPEELRVSATLAEVAKANTMQFRVWDCDSGVTDGAREVSPGQDARDISSVLRFIRDSSERAMWVLKDTGAFLKDPFVARALRNLAQTLPRSERMSARVIVLLSSPGADSELPSSLADSTVKVEWELPDRAEIGAIFDAAVRGLPEEDRAPNVELRELAVEAAVGLSAETVKTTFAKSLVTQKRRIVPAIVAAEKKRVVSGKGIEWFDPDARGLSAVGGLDHLKAWLGARQGAFTERARAFGLPSPKGLFLVGVPGCGKSLLAKATATAFACPLLRADFGGAQSKWVGESQENIRRVFKLAETIGKCVLWIDEIEKALAGATSGAADGGVSADALGAFLSWMQERKGQVFVIATANDVSKLPPELLRKGRFDEMFFVDLPSKSEAQEILRVSLRKFGRDPATIDVATVAAACDGFTGSEIDAIIPDGLFAAFADGERALTTSDLVTAAKSVTPLSRTATEKIAGLREWAKGKARPASRSDEKSAANIEFLDLDA